MTTETTDAQPDRGPSRGARTLVAVTLVLLLVPGLVGFDAWPMTAWRLFSLARDNSQTAWVVEAIDADGHRRTVSLEELPLRYRHAAWPMAELPTADEDRRERVCQALLATTVDVVPDLTRLAIVRDRQRLVERDGGWVLTHHPEAIHTCDREAAS